MKVPQRNGLVAIILILVWTILGSWLWFSGPRNGGFLVFGAHDSLWHLSLIAEIVQRGWPPQLPGMNGVFLTNYNYLGDLIWSLFVKIFRIEPWFWYFRLGNFTVIGSFLLILYLFAQKISQDQLTSIFAVLLASLGGTAAFLISLVNSTQANWQGNSFMLSPVIQYATNLHAILALTTLLASLYFYYLFFQNQKIKNGLLAGIFMGILFGIKAFYFLPYFLASWLIAFISLFKKQTRYFLPALTGTLVFALLFSFFVRSNSQTSLFQFKPFWLLEKMVEDPDRFYWPQRVLLDQSLRSTNDIFRLSFSTLEKLFLYVVGNFWLRLLGIFWLIKSSLSKNSTFYQLCLLTILLSAFLPLLIAPQPDHYNAVQIGRISLFLSGIFLGLSLKRKPFTLLVVFLLMIPTSLKVSRNTLFINQQEYQALNFLKEKGHSDEAVMDLVESHQYFSVVPALAQKKTYFSDTKQANLMGIDYQQRVGEQDKFLKGEFSPKEAEKFLQENKITYIYTLTKSFNQEEEESYQLNPIFSNLEITIYQPSL